MDIPTFGLQIVDYYRCNSFIVGVLHKFTVRYMNKIPVFVQSSELSNRSL